MSSPKDSFQSRLSHYREIKISVMGRNSGRTISNPVWFVFDEGRLFLLPVQGSDTQWYKNVVENPSLRIDARGEGIEGKAVPVTKAKPVASIVEKFRQKYGPDEVKKYYSKFDVAIRVEMP